MTKLNGFESHAIITGLEIIKNIKARNSKCRSSW
jgi:hypothetical protein